MKCTECGEELDPETQFDSRSRTYPGVYCLPCQPRVLAEFIERRVQYRTEYRGGGVSLNLAEGRAVARLLRSLDALWNEDP